VTPDWKHFEAWEDPPVSSPFWITIKHIDVNGYEVRYVREYWFDLGQTERDVWLKWDRGWFEENPRTSRVIREAYPNTLWLAWAPKDEIKPFEG